jgi:hypothetical protein
MALLGYLMTQFQLLMFHNIECRVFENRVLRRIFGPKRGKVTGKWIGLA